MKSSKILLGLALVAGLFFTGCTTPPKTASDKAASDKKAADEEYVYLPPKTGSNLQRKVKKSDLLAGKIPDADTSAVSEVSPEEFKRSIGHPVRQGD